MKQKYTISRNDDNERITLTEYSEVDKDIFAKLCTETFPIADLPTSLQEDPKGIIPVFRTRNMFPPLDYAVRIADALAELLADDARRIVEIKIDDKLEITERRLAAEKLAEKEMQADLADNELDTILESDTPPKTLSETNAAGK